MHANGDHGRIRLKYIDKQKGGIESNPSHDGNLFNI